MMLIGILWAAFAPVLLVLVAMLLAWLLAIAGVKRAIPLAIAAVVIPVAGFWFLDQAEFSRICEGEGGPVVYRHASADGIFLNSDTSNSFGMRYLREEGFSWVEARNVYKTTAWVRYERSASGSITTKDISEISARYEVREDLTRPNPHTSLSRTQVIDRRSGEVLARASIANFDGGRMNTVLGVWGTRSCPSAMDSPGLFERFYHLARNALR